MTIVLVNPHTTRLQARDNFAREPPSGLLLLAAVLENAGHLLRILDLELTPDPYQDIQQSLEDAQLVGLSFLTPTFPLAIQIADYIHHHAPHLPIIAGGPHASFMPEECFEKLPGLRAVVIGEGEIQVPFLISALLSTESEYSSNSLAHVPGIAFAPNPGRVTCTLPPPPVDVDALPLPARHLLSSKYAVATVIVNRGCPNQCSFCTRQALFRTVRVRSVASVLEELLQIQSLPNYQYVNFYDNINVNKQYVPELCKGMQKIGFHLPWGAELRIDRLTTAVARQMKEANCSGVATGVETANESLLRANGKVQRIQDVIGGLRAAVEADLTVQAYFVIGLPGETRDTFEETLAFIESSPLRPGRDIVDFFPATPFPGSRLWTQKDQLRWTLLDSDYANWDCHHQIMSPSTLTPSELSAMARDAAQIAHKYRGAEYPENI